MEPTRPVHAMSPDENIYGWEPPHDIKLNRGQRLLHALFSDRAAWKPRYAVQWPTGYGKTWGAAIAYAVARAQERVNRMLIIVPSDIQFSQYVGTEDDLKAGTKGDPGFIKDLEMLAIPYVGLEWCDKTRILKSHHQNTAEIFVASIQKIHHDPRLFADLMEKGRWLVVADEGHHYALHNTWGQALRSLHYEILLSMSATPLRHDRRATVAPEKQDVRIEIDEAVKEGAIRPMRSHISNYFIDIITGEEETPRRINLAELEQEAQGLDISEWEAQKKIRYNNSYLSQILSEAVSCLQQKNTAYPDQHQMLVFAMSCKHAAHVAEALNDLTQEKDFARWIGEGPNGQDDKTNHRNYNAFQNNLYPCLVQVNKAGEGFNNKRCSVMAFLNTLSDTPQARQQIGRGLRRNRDIANQKMDWCDAFSSVDANISSLLIAYSDATPSLTETDDEHGWLLDDDAEDLDEGLTRLYRIRDLFIVDVEYIETLLHYPFGTLEESLEVLREPLTEQLLPFGLESPSDEQLARVLKTVLAQQQHPILTSPKARQAAVQRGVKDAIGELARNALRCLYGPTIEKTRLGPTIRLIHTQWLTEHQAGHNDMDEKDFRRKYAWVQDINNRLWASREVPAWLRNI
jgi:superfamily II DNA or RNA helicase